MRRAMLRIGLVLCATALLPAAPGRSAQGVNLVNGIGLIDYTRKPDFKVGDWVRYRITAKSLLGAQDDYQVTVLIAGAETFWGEDCFWVETWTEPLDKPPQAIATLMSFAVFNDSLPIPHMQLYMRKTISELNEAGDPQQTLARRPPASLKKRTPIDDQIAWSVDTVGTDTVMVPRGTFRCVKVLTRQGKATSQDQRDSTVYTEIHDERYSYLTPGIPLTSLAREEIDNWFQRRSWQIGRSKDAAPLRLLERSRGEARLVDYGSGLSARMLTAPMQKDLRTRPAAAPPARKPAPAKRATPRTSG